MLCRECGIFDSYTIGEVKMDGNNNHFYDYICADCHNLIKTNFKKTNSNDNNVR